MHVCRAFPALCCSLSWHSWMFVCHLFGLDSSHTLLLLLHTCIYPPKQLPAVCYLELSSLLVWFFLFDRKQWASWPDAMAHLHHWMRRYPWKYALVFTAAGCSSHPPPLQISPCREALNPYGFPTFHHSFPEWQPCKQLLQSGFKTLEEWARVNFYSTLSLLPPSPVQPPPQTVFTSNLRSTPVETQRSLYSNVATVVTSPLQGRDPFSAAH